MYASGVVVEDRARELLRARHVERDLAAVVAHHDRLGDQARVAHRVDVRVRPQLLDLAAELDRVVGVLLEHLLVRRDLASVRVRARGPVHLGVERLVALATHPRLVHEHLQLEVHVHAHVADRALAVGVLRLEDGLVVGAAQRHRRGRQELFRVARGPQRGHLRLVAGHNVTIGVLHVSKRLRVCVLRGCSR